MKQSAKVIAVTGVCSWLGNRLIQLLEKDRSFRAVIALDVAKPPAAMQKTRFYPIDLTHPGIDEKIHHILKEEEVESFLHLAFLASPSHSRSLAHELEVIGTMHVLNALSQSNVRKLVAISTTAVYGASPKNPNFLNEDTPLAGNTESRFIRDKVEAELQMKSFKEKHMDRTVTVLRMASVLGLRVSTYLSRFLSMHVVPVIMGYDPLMQFLHEDDAVRAFELCIANDFDGTFNIVPEGVMPLTHVLAIGGRIPFPVPHILAYPLGQALWRAKIIDVPSSILDYLRYLWVADGTKAKQIMGFTPRYSTRKTVEIFYQIHPITGRNGREETIR